MINMAYMFKTKKKKQKKKHLCQDLVQETFANRNAYKSSFPKL